MDCFTADFLQFCNTTVKICLLGGLLSTCPSILILCGIFLKFPYFLQPEVLSCLGTREATLY